MSHKILRRYFKTNKGKFVDTNFLTRNGHKLEVTLLSHRRGKQDPKQKTVKVTKIIIHRFHNDITQKNDIAMLKLETAQPLADGFSYSCIPDEKFSRGNGDDCKAVGWGVTSKDRRIAQSLQEVSLPIRPVAACRNKYGFMMFSRNNQVCAGAPGKDTCKGDSGGGLFCRDKKTGLWHLYGVTSFGLKNGCGSGYGVYTRISELQEWIQNALKK